MEQGIRFKKHILIAVAATVTAIEKDPLDGKTTEEFAIIANINRKQLQAGFKAVTGMGPKQYRLQQRMLIALSMLKEGKAPIKEIALTCKFKSQRAFATAFKKRFKMTPSEFQSTAPVLSLIKKRPTA